MFKKFERIISQIKFLLGIRFGYVVFFKTTSSSSVGNSTLTCTIYYKNATCVKNKEDLIKDSINYFNEESIDKVTHSEITNIILMSEYNIKKMCGI